MGIRFRCPNGHKLHVKSFQAGKRGRCPQCGVKLLIPLESDPALVQEPKPSQASNADEAEVASELSLPTDAPLPPSTGVERAAVGEGQPPSTSADGPADPSAQPDGDNAPEDLASAAVDPSC